MNSSISHYAYTQKNHTAYPTRIGDQPFEIHTMSSLEEQLPGRRSRCEIIWVKKGNCSLVVGAGEYELTANTICRVAPGHPRRFTRSRDAEGYYISFSPEFMSLAEGYAVNTKWLDEPGDNFHVTLLNTDQEMEFEMEVIAGKMRREFTNYFRQKDELTRGLLNIFMIYFSRNIREEGHDVMQTRENELARKFLSLLRKNFVSQKMVSDYASQLFVTPNYLNRTVKKITGFTASHHIQQQIIIEAKRQAMYSTVSMKEIAYSLGFDNLAHFSKFFKNNCGINFTNFKKTLLREQAADLAEG